jgi:hypothetical protein
MISAFPVMVPKEGGGKRPIMLYIFTYGGDSHVSCFRECTPRELDALKADWPGYLTRRAKWIEWARANLRPQFAPGSMVCHFTRADVEKMLAFNA